MYRRIEKNGLVNLKWEVPKSVRWQIVCINHDDAGHLEYDKTYEKIGQVYWFKNVLQLYFVCILCHEGRWNFNFCNGEKHFEK